MQFEVLLPDRLLFSEEVRELKAEDASGCFGLLPAHADFLTTLEPSVVTCALSDGEERFIPVDGGILLLESGRVRIVTREAVVADGLGTAVERLNEMLEARRTQEAEAVRAFARLVTLLLNELPSVEARQ